MNYYVFIQKILGLLSLKKIAIWTLTGCVFVIGMTVYEHREKIAEFNPPKNSINKEYPPFNIGEQSSIKISNFVKDHANIVGVSVLSANLLKNTRTRVFHFADVTSTKFGAISVSQQFSGPKLLPLFSSNEINNEQMVRLLNGQFTCANYDTSLISEANPKPEDANMSICRISLPTYAGNFYGWIAIFVNKKLTTEEQLRLKILSEDLANHVYEKDVMVGMGKGIKIISSVN